MADQHQPIHNNVRREEALEALRAIGLDISAQLDMKLLLHEILESAVALLDADDGGGIELFDAAANKLKTLDWIGVGADLRNNLSPGEGFAGKAFLNGKPMAVSDYRTFPGRLHDFTDGPFYRVLTIPLRLREEGVGVLTVLRSLGKPPFDEDNIWLAELFAAQATIAIQNARLVEALEVQTANLETLVAARTVEVQQEHKRLTAIVEHAGEGIFFCSADGRVEFVNPTWERITGVSPDSIIHHRLGRVFGRAIQRDIEQLIARVADSEIWERETHARRPDGSEYDAELTIDLIHDPSGRIANLVGVVRDVTAARQVEQMRAKFVANVSHELRTPVTSLKIYHSLLTEGPPENRAEYLKITGEQIDRLERLIADLLDISRLDRGIVEVRKSPIDFNQLVRQVVALQSPQTEKRRITIRVDLAEDLPPIDADAERMEQVLNNLIHNAINYSNDGGEIAVQTSLQADDGRWMAVRISDQGIGISPEDQPYIFDRFYRSDTVKSTTLPGTGLGLSIVKEVIDQHGGSVSVRSRPGEGSTFTVLLPLSDHEISA